MTSTPPSPAAVATPWLWISRPSAGTGSLHPNATKPTTVQASASTCSCRNTRTLTWCSTPTPEALRGPAVPLQRCHPLTCSTSMTSSRSFMAKSRGWLWIDVAALRLQGRLTLMYSHHRIKPPETPHGALPWHQNPLLGTDFTLAHFCGVVFFPVIQLILTVKRKKKICFKWNLNR